MGSHYGFRLLGSRMIGFKVDFIKKILLSGEQKHNAYTPLDNRKEKRERVRGAD